MVTTVKDTAVRVTVPVSLVPCSVADETKEFVPVFKELQ